MLKRRKKRRSIYRTSIKPSAKRRGFLGGVTYGIKNFFTSIGRLLGGLFAPMNRKKPRLRVRRAPLFSREAVPERPKTPITIWHLVLDAGLLILCMVAGALFYFSLNNTDERINIVFTDGEQTASYRVHPATVSEFLSKADIAVEDADALSSDQSATLLDGSVISLTRAFPVAVNSNNATKVLKLTSGTVGEALKLAGVEYDADDELSSEPFESLGAGMFIQHSDVEVEYKTSYKALDYREKTVKDSSIYKGTMKVKQQGTAGEKQITQRITYKNGLEISREVVDQLVTKSAIDKIVLVGTKIRYQTNLVGEYREWKEAPTPGKNGWIAMTVSATAYCTGTRTAKGTKPRLGTIAVNSKYIPYYSKIYIPRYKNSYMNVTYGYGEALDTGPFRFIDKNHIDIWFNTEREAKNFGHPKKLTIYVKFP